MSAETPTPDSVSASSSLGVPSDRLESYRTLRAGITPGPWTVADSFRADQALALVACEDGLVRGVISPKPPFKTAHNNLKFIAAAPQIADDCLALAEENARLREVLAKFVDDEECRLDHHGNCQEHSLGNPCEVAEARKLLAGLGWSAP